ncbi:MAG: sulfur transferase domain-containing protein [Cyanobacteria bacterium P01_A01_bin.17]
MVDIIELSKQIAIAGQPTFEQLQDLGSSQFQSVMNLRSPQEDGFLAEEQQLLETQGLSYLNTGVKPDALTETKITELLQELKELPKPALVHCGSALRAAFISLIYLVTQQGMPLETAQKKVQELGLDFDAAPPLARWFQAYLFQQLD